MVGIASSIWTLDSILINLKVFTCKFKTCVLQRWPEKGPCCLCPLGTVNQQVRSSHFLPQASANPHRCPHISTLAISNALVHADALRHQPRVRLFCTRLCFAFCAAVGPCWLICTCRKSGSAFNSEQELSGTHKDLALVAMLHMQLHHASFYGLLSTSQSSRRS